MSPPPADRSKIYGVNALMVGLLARKGPAWMLRTFPRTFGIMVERGLIDRGTTVAKPRKLTRKGKKAIVAYHLLYS